MTCTRNACAAHFHVTVNVLRIVSVPTAAMFPEHVFYLLYFFNLFGMCTEPYVLRSSRWRQKRWSILIMGFYTVYLCFLCGFILDSLDEFYDMFDLLNMANDAIKFAGAIIAHSVVIVESYFKRNVQRQFWTVFRKIQADFKCSDHTIVLRSYFVRLGLFFGAVTYIEFSQAFAWYSEGGEANLFFFIAYVSLLLMQQVRVFHYLFFVHLLNHQLHEIEVGMRNLADASEIGTMSRARLRWIRMYYESVHELCNCLNEVFGWSNAASILYLFLLFAVDMNWTYWQLHSGEPITVEGTIPISYAPASVALNRHDPFPDAVWTSHVVLLIIYLFKATDNSTTKVNQTQLSKETELASLSSIAIHFNTFRPSIGTSCIT